MVAKLNATSNAPNPMTEGVPTPGEIYAGALKNLQGYGNAEQAALRQSYQNALGMGMQNLTSSGLAGTTLAPSMRMGYMKQYQLALNDLGGKVAAQRANIESTVGFQAIQAGQAAEQLGIQQGYLGLAGEQLAAQKQQFTQQLGLQRELGLGQLGVQQGYLGLAGQQLTAQQQQFAQQLGLQRELGTGQLGLQQGYLGLAQSQQALESQHWDLQRQDALAMAQGYGGWGGGSVNTFGHWLLPPTGSNRSGLFGGANRLF